MARRSSRLRSRNSSTPQPVKTRDVTIQSPRTAPRLGSLVESDEMPGAFPRSASPQVHTPSKRSSCDEPFKLSTPTDKTPIQPSGAEMHPQQFQSSTAKPREEARWLGFASMGPYTETSKHVNKLVPAAGTPSKVKPIEGNPPFQFTFRAGSTELSVEARQMMAEKREEAAKIKEQLATADEDSQMTEAGGLGRKIATPKGKAGRFSDVHKAHFKKMDSIASHVAASKPAGQSQQSKIPGSLKRSNSKAELSSDSSSKDSPVKRTTVEVITSLAPSRDSRKPSDDEPASPSKRVKRSLDDDASTARPANSGSKASSPPTPKEATPLRMHPGNPHTAGVATPTRSSLARASSVKSVKGSMIPALNRSPSKSDRKKSSSSTPLLLRSPSKTSPTKVDQAPPAVPESPLLSRSPSKLVARHASVQEHEHSHDTADKSVPLLAQGAKKHRVDDEHSQTGSEEKAERIPLLARTPAKASHEANPFSDEAAPTMAGSTKLMERFKHLRKSPIKSILRSPQRLFSDDPVKVANGTHLATPPAAKSKTSRLLPTVPATAPVMKRVLFTASTKGDDEHAGPDTPSQPITRPSQGGSIKQIAQATFTYPALPSEHGSMKSAPPKQPDRRMTLGGPGASRDFTFRVGDGISFALSPSSTGRGVAAPPSIRHVSAEPDLERSTMSKKRKHVDSDEEQRMDAGETSDKENKTARHEPEAKESQGLDRPSKRMKPTASSEAKSVLKKPALEAMRKRVPTLGVKPKDAPKVQKPKKSTAVVGGGVGEAGAQGKPRAVGMLSRDRLNSLAMPKRRVGE